MVFLYMSCKMYNTQYTTNKTRNQIYKAAHTKKRKRAKTESLINV